MNDAFDNVLLQVSSSPWVIRLENQDTHILYAACSYIR